MKTNISKKVYLLILMIIFSIQLSAQWQQIGADIDGEAINDYSGEAVSINSDGTIVAIGAKNNDGIGNYSGHVRIFQNIGGSWVQLGSDIDAEAAMDYCGNSVCLNDDGTRVAIGAYMNDSYSVNAGHARVFEFNGTNWVQLGSDIDGDHEDDWMGWSVSLNSDGNILAVSATRNDANGGSAGQVKVFEYDGGNWVQLGGDIYGESGGDQSGFSISLNSNGHIIAIGAPENNGNGSDAGQVRIYEYSGGNWLQIGSDIDGNAADDRLGQSVSINSDGTVVVAGAIWNDSSGVDAGAAKVFENSGGNWIQRGSDICGEAAGDYFGWSVSINSNGNIVAIGAHLNDGSYTDAGHVRILKFIGGSWVQIYNDIDGEAIYDRSGCAVSIDSDGNTVAIGANRNSGNGSTSGHVRVYKNCATTDSIFISLCDTSYLSPSGNYTWTISGIYYDTIPNFSGCDSLLTIDLTLNNSPIIDIIGDSIGCDSIILYEGSGILSNQYLWSNGDTTQTIYVTTTDIYSLTVTDGNGCFGADTIDIEIYQSYNYTEIDTICNGDSLLWHGSYFDTTGIYTTNYNTVNNCDSIYELQLFVETCTGKNTIHIENDIVVYPNPTTGIISIVAQGIENIQVLNLQGKEIYNGKKNEIDLRKEPDGIYIIRVITGKQTITRKFIKQ